jgi:hypothetical protein
VVVVLDNNQALHLLQLVELLVEVEIILYLVDLERQVKVMLEEQAVQLQYLVVMVVEAVVALLL